VQLKWEEMDGTVHKVERGLERKSANESTPYDRLRVTRFSVTQFMGRGRSPSH
jgi:hypothetical protein